MKKMYIIPCIIILMVLIAFFVNQAGKTKDEVVIYTSVDQVFSEPVLKQFEKETGIRVLPVYDVEAAKTTGLVNRLIAEKNAPKADVFWNGEFAQTLLLKEKGILAVYRSSSSKGIPSQYIDADGFWTGVGGRARVILVNKTMLSPDKYPKSIFDLMNQEYAPDKIGIAYPMFGTAATHAAALYAELGPDKGRDFFESLSKKGIKVYDGNSVVRDMVVNGQLVVGLTDTDDALAAIEKGHQVEMIFPDQEKGGIGTLIVPNTVALISGANNPAAGKKLIDYILSKETEKMLIDAGWINLSIRESDDVHKDGLNAEVKGMKANLEEIYKQMNQAKDEMQEIFVR